LFPIKIGPQHKKSVGRGNMYTYYPKHSIQSIQEQQQQIWRKQIIFTFQIFKISEIEPLLEPLNIIVFFSNLSFIEHWTQTAHELSGERHILKWASSLMERHHLVNVWLSHYTCIYQIFLKCFFFMLAGFLFLHVL
jgi:ABC-type branched-subunit amino acid transport system ATPase component